MTPLKNKMLLKGISITSVHKSTGVHKADVSHFVNGHVSKVSRINRRVLREYFITFGFLPRPKPRPAPRCRQCGLEYPTRKQSIESVPSNQCETHSKKIESVK